MGTERSAFHSGPEDFPPTKAVSIRVDPICHSHFSLATRRRTIHSGLPTTRTEFAARAKSTVRALDVHVVEARVAVRRRVLFGADHFRQTLRGIARRPLREGALRNGNNR